MADSNNVAPKNGQFSFLAYMEDDPNNNNTNIQPTAPKQTTNQPPPSSQLVQPIPPIPGTSSQVPPSKYSIPNPYTFPYPYHNRFTQQQQAAFQNFSQQQQQQFKGIQSIGNKATNLCQSINQWSN
eukprot:TRINITY_DN26443_c0_g1_i2.p2 TRINITY_DN26443_c0_g1~~TRINITY_DN26443_c0_g1_i2.p2  ORF type:complete len:126 (-),score=15.79 TRINITY_DN26443_c0_g1_i2:130-507(-)